MIKLINGCELDDDNTSANSAAKKAMIDNCLVERNVLNLLILASRVVLDSIQGKRSVN